MYKLFTCSQCKKDFRKAANNFNSLTCPFCGHIIKGVELWSQSLTQMARYGSQEVILNERKTIL
jgi:DNA-directed RNA polymerase subunit RPC12/RpoP